MNLSMKGLGSVTKVRNVFRGGCPSKPSEPSLADLKDKCDGDVFGPKKPKITDLNTHLKLNSTVFSFISAIERINLQKKYGYSQINNEVKTELEGHVAETVKLFQDFNFKLKNAKDIINKKGELTELGKGILEVINHKYGQNIKVDILTGSRMEVLEKRKKLAADTVKLRYDNGQFEVMRSEKRDLSTLNDIMSTPLGKYNFSFLNSLFQWDIKKYSRYGNMCGKVVKEPNVLSSEESLNANAFLKEKGIDIRKQELLDENNRFNETGKKVLKLLCDKYGFKMNDIRFYQSKDLKSFVTAPSEESTYMQVNLTFDEDGNIRLVKDEECEEILKEKFMSEERRKANERKPKPPSDVMKVYSIPPEEEKITLSFSVPTI